MREEATQPSPLIWCCRLALGLAALLWFPQLLAQQQSRVALIIGNAAYTAQDKLRNPIGDAQLMARVFRQIGFDHVEVLADADQIRLLTALSEFQKRAQAASLAVIYFSGHGMKHDGERQNYVLPIDMPSLAANAALDADIALRSKAVSEGALLDAMGSARYQLLILDACRDNASGTKSGATKGLARRIGVGAGRLIAYATEENRTAQDGTGSNSPYAESLARHFSNPQLSIVQALDATAQEVRESTRLAQQPMKSGDLAWNVGFNLKNFSPHSDQASQEQMASNPESAAWELAIQSRTAAAFRSYLHEFPQGRYVKAATQALVALNVGEQRSYRNLQLSSSPSPWNLSSARVVALASSGVAAIAIRRNTPFSSIEPDVVLLDASGSQRAVLVGPSNSVVHLEFSADSRHLLGQQYGRDCYIWSIPQSSLVQKLEGARQCSWSPSLPDQLLYVTTGGIATFSLGTQRSTTWPRTKGHSLLMLPPGGLILSEKDDKLHLWPRGLEQPPIVSINIKDVRLAVARGMLFTATAEQITVYKLPTMQALHRIQTGIETHGDFTWFHLFPSPDGQYVGYMMSQPRSEFRVWRLGDTDPIYRARLARLSSDHDKVAWSGNSSRVAFNLGWDSTGNNPRVSVLDVQTMAVGAAAGYFSSVPLVSADGASIRTPAKDFSISE